MAYNTKPLEDCKLVGLEIDVGLRNEMKRFIQERIIHNLEATKRLLELGEDYKDIVVGYTLMQLRNMGKFYF